MPIEPGALALARAEGEELLEDFLVSDDPGDQRHQHQHGCRRRQPTTPRVRHLQLKVEAIEEVPAAGIPGLDPFTGQRIELALLAIAASPFVAQRLPEH
ncbi:hypothetical protein D3C80_1972840 [compost metagenome]